MRVLFLTAVAAFATLVGCAPNATIDSAYGRPDSTEWTYFEGSAQDVVTAISRYYSIRDIATESTRDENGGIVLTLAPQSGSADTAQILVQATNVEGFASRAQLYPTHRPLPRDLEIGVAGDL